MGLAVLTLLLVFLLIMVSRDFTNGILFFIKSITNIYFGLLIMLLFGLTSLFGGLASNDIITNRRNAIWTALKYSFITISSIIIYLGAIGLIKDKSNTFNNLNEILESSYLESYIKAGLLTTVPMLIVWSSVTFRIKKSVK